MRQLQLFTPTELAGMRDRTASRNYSPGRDEFRRTHERHRQWGASGAWPAATSNACTTLRPDPSRLPLSASTARRFPMMCLTGR